MAMALNVPANRLRHKAPRDSGGSFGVKQAVFPYVVLMCLASRKAGAPVKWVEFQRAVRAVGQELAGGTDLKPASSHLIAFVIGTDPDRFIRRVFERLGR